MKAKTIQKVIQRKVDAWLKTIEDEGVRTIAKENAIVSGGCIASMLLKEEVKDFDVYFRTYEATAAVARYYINIFKPRQSGIPCDIVVVQEKNRVKVKVKSAGVASSTASDKPYEYFESATDGEAGEYLEGMTQDAADAEDMHESLKQAVPSERESKRKKGIYVPVFVSTNAITLSDGIQLVLRFAGEPEEIHANYDFVHCMNYWKAHDGQLVLKQDALEAILAKELRYVGSRFPVCSLIRIRKFLLRGWSINAGQMIKMILQISELDLKNLQVLEDQLTGVDVAYFAELMTKLNSTDPERINTAYICELIDRIF